VLKPGGLYLVIFSNRMFPEKAVRIWRELPESERALLVEDYFTRAGCFDAPLVYMSRGRPRPADDKYAGAVPESDPVFAVYAQKKGGDPLRRPALKSSLGDAAAADPSERMNGIKETLRCPYCGDKLSKWAVPDHPFGQTWDNDYMYICFNDQCPYYIRGWETMSRQRNHCSYRLMYHPEKDCCLPVPVPTPMALKEGIVADSAA
jgi:hypothetical protein